MHRLACIALAAGLVVAAACTAGAQSQVAATILLDLTGPRPTAQLVIGESPPVTAIFDTGAAASVLRLSYAERIQAPNQGPAAAHGPSGAPVSGFRTTLNHARLGDAQFGDALAVALEIPLQLEGIDAIISPGVFSGRLVRFDFAASAAQILPLTRQNTPAGAGEPYMGENTHGMLRRTPGVVVALPGRASFVAALDTGSNRGLSMPLAMAQGLALSEALTPAEPQRLVGATHAAFAARIAGLVRVGPLGLENPEVRFVDGAEEAIVGMEILRQGVIVLDPRGHRSWFLAPS